MNQRDTDEIWRLYRREWVIVHTVTMTSDTDALPCLTAANAWMEENLRDRVHKSDIQLEMNTDLKQLFWCHVKVFKDNMKAEFKHRSDAEMYATARKYDEYTIVPRNSAADHNIRNYGVTKL